MARIESPRQEAATAARVGFRFPFGRIGALGLCLFCLFDSARGLDVWRNLGPWVPGVAWNARNLGTSGAGQAAPLTSDTGYFWFFQDTNLELVIKVLDARAFSGFFWVFYGALSNVEYTITVTDTETQDVKTYLNPQNTMASVADTAAFD